ncbi:MAG: hypothetical protein ACYTBP_16365, partial [Planctomycetota bacterium]
NEAKIMKNKPNVLKCRHKRNLSYNKDIRKPPASLPKNKPNLSNATTSATSFITDVYENKPLSTKNETQIMQNKPNFLAAQMNVTPATAKIYGNFPLSRRRQNKPNQTQFQTCFSPPRRRPKLVEIYCCCLVHFLYHIALLCRKFKRNIVFF